MSFVRIIKDIVRSTFKRFNIDVSYSIDIKQEKYRVALFNRLDTDMIIDVGANIGQYALNLIKYGYYKGIISFEPINYTYEKLLSNSKLHDNWTIYERCALGDNEGEIEINVAENYESSSIYPVLEKSITAAPQTHTIKKEKVKIIKLADVAELQRYKRMHLKIDVQGYEDVVLKGAKDILDKVISIEIEISLVPLYEGALSPETLLIKLKEYGFVPIFFTSAFDDINTGGVLQLDGLFVRNELVNQVDNL